MCHGVDGYNAAVTGDVEATLGVNCGMQTGRNGVIVLNDQGGSFMNVSEDVSGTLRSQMRSHPTAVVQETPTFALQGNGIDRADTAGCNGKGWSDAGKSYTIDTIDRHAVAYSVHPISSNSMKSENPNTGFSESDVARTLDCTSQDPSKNQGGTVVVQSFAVDCRNASIDSDKNGTLQAKSNGGISYNCQNVVMECFAAGNGQPNNAEVSDVAGALNCMHDEQIVVVADKVTPSFDEGGWRSR